MSFGLPVKHCVLFSLCGAAVSRHVLELLSASDNEEGGSSCDSKATVGPISAMQQVSSSPLTQSFGVLEPL